MILSLACTQCYHIFCQSAPLYLCHFIFDWESDGKMTFILCLSGLRSTTYMLVLISSFLYRWVMPNRSLTFQGTLWTQFYSSRKRASCGLSSESSGSNTALLSRSGTSCLSDIVHLASRGVTLNASLEWDDFTVLMEAQFSCHLNYVARLVNAGYNK